MNSADLGVWLDQIELSQYANLFKENGIDLAILPSITADDLTALGISKIGHRRKLLVAIASLRPSRHQRGPLSDFGTERAERRQVAVMFADLAGYTRLSIELDTEDLHQVRTQFTRHVESIVIAHGGAIERHIGDSVMSVFGALNSRGNDVELAVTAAIAIRDSMAVLSKAIGRTIGVHLGIAAGEVLTVSRRHGSP